MWRCTKVAMWLEKASHGGAAVQKGPAPTRTEDVGRASTMYSRPNIFLANHVFFLANPHRLDFFGEILP